MSLSGASPGYLPRPSIAHRLMLSSLGALLDGEGAWTTRPETVRGSSRTYSRGLVSRMEHLTALGRDHYVKVVDAGYLCRSVTTLADQCHRA